MTAQTFHGRIACSHATRQKIQSELGSFGSGPLEAEADMEGAAFSGESDGRGCRPASRRLSRAASISEIVSAVPSSACHPSPQHQFSVPCCPFGGVCMLRAVAFMNVTGPQCNHSFLLTLNIVVKSSSHSLHNTQKQTFNWNKS